MQPAESSIVNGILVHEGDTIQAGQVLMRLDMQVSEADTPSLEGEYQRDGIVEHVSADSADGNTSNGNTSNDKTTARNQPLVYRALVSLKAMQLKMDDRRFPFRAGKQTNAEILLGTCTVMEYLLSPVRRAWHEAENGKGHSAVSRDSVRESGSYARDRHAKNQIGILYGGFRVLILHREWQLSTITTGSLGSKLPFPSKLTPTTGNASAA